MDLFAHMDSASREKYSQFCRDMAKKARTQKGQARLADRLLEGAKMVEQGGGDNFYRGTDW